MKLNRTIIFIITLSLFFLFSCNNSTQDNAIIDYETIPTFSKNKKAQAIIEIPAGTSHKYEYNYETKKFEVELIEGKERIVDFLPYVVNYGFIASTLMDENKGGDGDALDILVISESVETGTIMEIEPIAIMRMIDDGETDYKILAIPTDNSKSIIKATTLDELKTNYPEIISIIENWFLSYKHNNKILIDSWGDEKQAMEEINKWLK